MAEFIQCDDGGVTVDNNGTLRCPSGANPVFYTEQQVIDLYGIPKMDNEDYVIVSQFAYTVLIIAFGVKLIRKIWNV